MSKTAIHSLPSGLDHAAQLSSRLGLPLYPIDIHRFPDGELRITTVRATDTAVVYAPLDQPNEKLLALLFTAEALRREGAARLVLVAPYLCYMRQDTAFKNGEAISQKVVGRLLAASFDRVITVDAHLHRTRNIHDVFPGIESENLSAVPAIGEALRADRFSAETVVVGPDEESRAWVSDLANRLGVRFTVAKKHRHGDRSVEISFPDTKMLAAAPALVVDDIVASGGTLVACAKALSAAGAACVDAIIVHALFSPESARAFSQAGIRSIRSSTSIPHPTNAIRLDGLLAAALRSEVGP